MRGVKIWLVVGCVMIGVMVLIGGITRLTDSGLSITEWAVVKGTLPPLSEAAWNQAFEKYKQIPEYQLKHAHFTLTDFKRIFFWEYFHRLWGRLMGFVFFIPFVWFWLKGKLNRTLKIRGIWILFGGGAVGSLGWFMVSSGLSERPDVSHYRLAIHLLAAFSLFAYVYWTYLKIQSPKQPRTQFFSKRIKVVTKIAFVLLGLQITYGAFTAGLDAGLLYNTWPLMNGHYIPENLAPFDGVWHNLSGHKDMVQFIHRNIGLVLALITIALCLMLRKTLLVGRIWFWLLLIVIAQFLLGILTLVDAKSGDISVFLGTFHQIGALILLVQYVRLSFKIWGQPIDQ